jgi:hypothetical protein
MYNWGHGSSGRVLAQGPEFDSQYCQKKKKLNSAFRQKKEKIERALLLFAVSCLYSTQKLFKKIFFLGQDLYLAQAGLEFTVFLPQLYKYWNYRCAPPYPAQK